MTAESPLGPVSAYVRGRIAALLDQRRVVVWHDPDGVFRALLDKVELPGCVVVSAVGSPLRARREAEHVYRRLEEPGESPRALTSITEALQLALEIGALRVLLPAGNKAQFPASPSTWWRSWTLSSMGTWTGRWRRWWNCNVSDRDCWLKTTPILYPSTPGRVSRGL